MGLHEVPPWEAAELVCQLPASSRVARSVSGADPWPEDSVYLALIEYWLHALVWRDAKKSTRGPKPEPIIPDGIKREPEKDVRHITGVSLPISEIDAMFRVKPE